MPSSYESLLSKDEKVKPNFISHLFFAWMNGILKLGYKRTLTDDDLPLLSDENKAQDLVNDLNELWMDEINNAEKMGKKPRLWKVVWKLFPCTDHLLLLGIKYFEMSMQFALAILEWFYLMSLEDAPHMDKTNVVPIVVGIGIASLMRVFCYHHYDYLSSSMGMRLKIAVIGLIHKKITESRRSDLSKFTTGHIVNLVSNDAKRMEELFVATTECLVIPFIVVAAVLSLSLMVGWQSLAGLLLMLLLVALNLFLAKLFADIRLKQANITDKRLAIMSEIISGIRTVKMYAWEWSYKHIVGELRRQEINRIKAKTCIATSFTSMLFTVTPLATLLSICAILYDGYRVYAVTIFTLTIILDICTECLGIKIGYHYRNARDAKVSLDRVEEFLYKTCTGRVIDVKCFEMNKNEDLEKSNSQEFPGSGVSHVEQASLTKKGNESRVVLTNISAAWTKYQRCVLHQVSLTVSSNQLLMVTGSVGSGKSSLLMAILEEIHITKGDIDTQGRIAYVSQIPWIFSGTVRDNIVFGQRFDETRYNRILEICDLHKDIICFPNGDLSIIGQRGVGLSGGQRARVSLARAVYTDADIFLMDDPLSAVDARVGQHIFDKCICGELSSRIRIVVTHQVQHLPRADKIAVVQEGIIIQGTYSELKDKGFFFKIQEKQKTVESIYNKDLANSDKLANRDMKEDEEDRATGIVSWRLYWEFFTVGSPAVLIGCFGLFYAVVQASILAPSWWMSRMAHMSLDDQRSLVTLGTFGGLVAGAFVLCFSKDFIFDFAILRCTRKLHDKMTLAVVKSPVLFFDTNPAGRIMNRFSKDIGAMDDLLPVQLSFCVINCFNVLGVLVLGTIVNVWIVFAVIPLVILFFYITLYYMKTARELKRMEAIRCSPVYDHVAETITGLEVIRTSNMEEECRTEMLRFLNEHTRAFFLVIATARWFGFCLDLLCAVLLVAVAVVGLVGIQDHALAGMLLMLATKLFGITQYGLRMATEVESQMTSVERVMTYSKLPSEPGYSRQDEPPDDWPSQGALSIRDMSMVYLDGGPRVLKDVSLDVQPKEKVGIAGRTGAGKSSLVAALFRMPDPQGQVLIDGVDLGTINIQAARRSMAVITQDPMLFAGSLKKNLDPFNYFTDQEVFTALEEVQLKNKVNKLDNQLEFCIGEGGSGFSVGERQLLCLARALLQKCKILVLDEATANVDYKTDKLIQQVIRDKFSNCTVLTIAHRLNTIMDYDKVVVLDRGQVVEHDNPRILSENENGFFSRLVTSTSLVDNC